MDFGFTPEEEKLRREVRDFLQKEVTPEVIAEVEEYCGGAGPVFGRKFIQKMGARGWLCPTWPKEYGGLDSPEMVGFMMRDEMTYAGAPVSLIGASMAGPTILRCGSDEMKKEFLPRIAKGEIEMALGYTEPQAGSDLAALEIRAEDKSEVEADDKGDYFLLNGQKMFNTHAHFADYHWLGARTETDPAVRKHRGISLMLVDLKSPGITIRNMTTIAGWKTNEVFYDNVKVPKKNLVGEINRGFYYIMTALDFERMFPIGGFRRLFDELVKYTKEIKRDGKPLSQDPVIRQKLAQMAIELEAASLLYYQLAYMLDKGEVPNYQSSMQKVFATETAHRLADVA
ncbi:MAG: acyl-CoA dehydrogenase family protein, partial [Dehalococcoidia bacterium]|nr:acyl-CoA dehydrogenase family protein [Dehalococcoidia bacterium]